MLAAQAIQCGDADIIVAGGVENMSASAFLAPGARKGYRMGAVQLLDSMITDGLTDVFSGAAHGHHRRKRGLPSTASPARTRTSLAAPARTRLRRRSTLGRFKDEIVPIEIPQRKGPPALFEQDEHPRFGTTMEALAKLKPAFKPDGTVTAGNASGINDAAAAVVVMSAAKAKELGIKPLAVIRSYGVGGVDPSIMGIGPVPASRKALQKAGLKISDMDLIEANEAFAAQAIAVGRDLEIPADKLNVNGGAIALGHPIGASGARILVTLLYEMQKRQSKLGLATLCIGGGMGAAMIVERA